MATALALDEAAYPHIVRTPGVRWGKARIDGTRVCVKDIVELHRTGTKPDEIREHFSDRALTLAEIYAALAYYYDHLAEIDADLAAEERTLGETERQWQELVARHGGEPPTDPTPEERAIPRPVYIPSRS